MDTNRKLKLQWVTDVIQDDYKSWDKGDVVLIDCQTSTGKTEFIKNKLMDYLNYNEKLLFVCNRKSLKNQVKIDLLKKFNQKIPETLDELDKISWFDFGKLHVTTYQTIDKLILNKEYNIGEFSLDQYRYIVLDECQYALTDASFNSTTRKSFNEFILNYNPLATKIHMSGTMDEIREIIKNTTESEVSTTGLSKLHYYNTGRDFSYLNCKYFKSLDKDILATISNDKSEDKWLIFVSNEKDGTKLHKGLGDEISSFITAKTSKNNSELKLIINESRFEKKVLISTKVLDNGVNFKDDKIRHVVIMGWDKTTFMQMVGRVRIDINNARTINLYICGRYRKSFTNIVKSTTKKLTVIKQFYEENIEFCREYDNDLKTLGKYNDLFYRDHTTGDWALNKIGYIRLVKDHNFYNYMAEKFNVFGEYAFIDEQLSWLGLENSFEETNMIENVVSNDIIVDLAMYLKSIEGKIMLNAKDRIELIEKINVRDGTNNRLLKNIKTQNGKLEEIKSNFRIVEFETSRIINGKKKNFKNAWKVVSIN